MRAHLEHNEAEQAFIDAHSVAPHVAHLTATGAALTIDGFHVHGKDVSSYQPIGGFTEGGREFGIFKATEGITYADPHFAGNRDAAHGPGVAAAGVYHFARNQRNTAEREYAHFRAVVGPPRDREFMVLDAETGWDESWFAAFADAAAKDGWGRRVFYTYSAMWSGNPHGSLAAHFTDGWVAGYGRTMPAMLGWPSGPTLWQHTDGQGSVTGNDGATDCSVFVPNDLDKLRAWIGAGGDEMTKEEIQALAYDQAVKAIRDIFAEGGEVEPEVADLQQQVAALKAGGGNLDLTKLRIVAQP